MPSIRKIGWPKIWKILPVVIEAQKIYVPVTLDADNEKGRVEIAPLVTDARTGQHRTQNSTYVELDYSQKKFNLCLHNGLPSGYYDVKLLMFRKSGETSEQINKNSEPKLILNVHPWGTVISAIGVIGGTVVAFLSLF